MVFAGGTGPIVGGILILTAAVFGGASGGRLEGRGRGYRCFSRGRVFAADFPIISSKTMKSGNLLEILGEKHLCPQYFLQISPKLMIFGNLLEIFPGKTFPPSARNNEQIVMQV